MAAPTRPGQFALFGGVEPAPVQPSAMRSPKANGYAAPPGTGPNGETCGTCQHCTVHEATRGPRTRRWYKCEVMVRNWTYSRGSDVLLTSPACRHFQPGEPHPSTVRKLRHPEWKA